MTGLGYENIRMGKSSWHHTLARLPSTVLTLLVLSPDSFAAFP